MQEQYTNAALPDAAHMARIQKKLSLESTIRNGIGWFFWIGGLSIINTIIYLFNGSVTFVVGLGITQLVDGFVAGLANRAGANASLVQAAGITLDLAIAGLFVAAGVLGIKRQRWVIITGMILYALDTILFVVFKVWLGIVFHALALWGLWSGLRAIDQLKKLEDSAPIVIPSMTHVPTTNPITSSGLFRAFGKVVIGLLLFLLLTVVIILIASN